MSLAPDHWNGRGVFSSHICLGPDPIALVPSACPLQVTLRETDGTFEHIVHLGTEPLSVSEVRLSAH